MNVISIITQKGGVGKTTATIHIGASLAEKGYKVLLIDFDTQKNLSLGCNIENFEYTVRDFIYGKTNPVFHLKGRNNNLFILAGSDVLNEKSLNRNSLKKAIKSIENQFDFILIDCPPKPINEELSFGEIAVIASDFVLSPILADKYSIAGIGSFFNSVLKLKKEGLAKANILGVFFNVVEENTRHFQNYYKLLKESDGGSFIINNYIRKDIDIKNSMDEGKTIFEVKPFGRAALDYERLTDEILLKVNDYEK